MYKATQEFQDRFMRVGSMACQPTARLQNIEYYGDKSAEMYAPTILTREQRNACSDLLKDIAKRRKTIVDPAEISQLRSLERKVLRALKASKLTAPKHHYTFTQCFIRVAESMLNQDVFQKIVEEAQKMYHNVENIQPHSPDTGHHPHSRRAAE